MAIENFGAGTLIIPMQEAFQNNGMWLAYGLVHKLLSNGIPVKWAIRPGKPYNGTDFTATTENIVTMATYTNQAYSGGPFIIDVAYVAAALPIINAWQAANPATTVHRATAPFNAPIAATLNRRPRIAVEETNSSIIIGYLNAAKIPDSLGNTWTSSSPDILSPDEVGNGAFFGYNTTDPCKQLVYDIFLSPHTSDNTWTNATNAAMLDTFVKIGGYIHATCHSISAIENFAGPFLTTSGFGSFGNKGDPGTFTVDVPDFPVDQAVPTSGKVQVLPGGAEQTWLHSSVTYLPSAQVLAHFSDNGIQYDFMVGGSYKGGAGAGKIVYEGGHQYSTSLPYSNNADGPYLRFLYNSIFFAVAKPRIVLQTNPRNIPAGFTTTVTFAVDNDGGSNAVGLTLSITLAPWAVYNAGSATIPPTGIVGQTLTWDATALASSTGPGTVLTFTAQVTPPGTGIQSVATYSATFADSFNENYTLPNYCASINAVPGAAPGITKTPANQSAYPNSTVTWTITAGNYGTLALNNVKITDTLPPGLTFISSVPAPSSVVGGGINPTVITWQSPQIPASIPPMTPVGITITLTAMAPPAITATFINNVNLQGTDTTPAQYSVDASATLQVNNRPPVPTIIRPNGGELVCQGLNIEWTAQDPDGDSLTYELQYSADGGTTYTTIVSGLTGACLPPGPPYCSFFWDTTGLPSGSSYLVKVIASDGELAGEDVSAGPFTVDNTPPSLTWVFPDGGSAISTTPVNLQVSATDNVDVASVEFLYSTDGINFTSIGTDTTPSGTIYETLWELEGLPKGEYILRAIAIDLCGKTTSADINVTVNLPPTVQVLSPNGGEVVCRPGMNITWTASDPNGDALTYALLYSADGGASFTVVATGLTGVCMPGPCSYFWDTTGLPSRSNYLVKVMASDGVLSTEDVSDGTFTIDNSPPVVSFTSPITGSFVRGTVTLQVTATDNNRVSGVTFEYSPDGGITYNLIGMVPFPPVNDTFAISWNTTLLPDGPYKLRATAMDPCNNKAEAVIDVTVDNTPPTVSIPSPPGGSVVSGTVPLVVTTADNECLAKVQLYIDGLLVHTETVPGGGKAGDFVFEWDTTGYAEGPHEVRALATDCSGLTAETVQHYIIDNLPEHFAQVLVDGDLVIPPQKPDVERVIDMAVTPRVEDINIFPTIDGTKVTVRGFVEIGLTYVASDGVQTEHFAHFEVPFNGMILFPDLPLDAKVEPVIQVEHSQWHLINARKIKKKIVLFIGIKER